MSFRFHGWRWNEWEGKERKCFEVRSYFEYNLCSGMCVCPYVSYIPHIYTSFDMRQLYAEIMAIILGYQHS